MSEILIRINILDKFHTKMSQQFFFEPEFSG